MDLISWSLSAIDSIWSSKKSAATEESCPPGCFPAGYVIDYSGTWRVLCLSVLSIEDSEDLFIFFLVLGSIMATCGGVIYLRRRFDRAVQRFLQSKILDKIDGLVTASISQSAVMAGQSTAITGISGKMDELKLRLEIAPP